MALPKKIEWVTFDVYGTLIDWEEGIYQAFSKEAERDGFTIERDQLIPLYMETEQDIEGGSYELYAEVLRRTAVRISRELDWPLEPSRSGFLPDSVQRWKPFRETNPTLEKLKKKFEIGLISNIDDKLLGQTRRHMPVDFDLVVTAQQVRSYKPDPAHFTEAERRMGGKRGWVHVGASYYHDIEPALKKRIPVIWVNRHKEPLEQNQKKPTAEVHSLREAAKLWARRSLRAVGVHADAVVAVSGFWQTTCTALRAHEEAFLIDSPVLPARLEALPSLLRQAAFPQVQGLLVTHADWDHLLGRYAFPDATIGCGESTAERLRAEPGAAQRKLRAFDDEHYVERPGPLGLAGAQPLPVPGRCELGQRALELHPAPGHTADGMAILAPWAELLCCGDYLSPVEIPWLSPGGSLPAYRDTLHRLRGLVERVRTVIPGHGAPLSREDALAVLEADLAYLDALERDGEAARLPEGRASAAQRRIHAENVARAHGGD